MSMVIENGSGVAGANSYGILGGHPPTDADATLAAARSFASDRNVTLSADDAVLTAALIYGTQWIESQSALFVGRQATITQGLSWPRCGVRNGDGSKFSNTQLPNALLNALFQLCIEQNNGVVLLPTIDYNGSGGYVTMSKVDVIETKYSEKIGTSRTSPLMPAVLVYMNTLFYTGGGFGLPTVRV